MHDLPDYLFDAMGKGLSRDSLWQHYKGHVVKILSCCRRETDGESMVVYLCNGTAWCRPIAEWEEEVINSDGDNVPRFVRVFREKHHV